MALNRQVDIAINHDPEAIIMHTANHPDATHYVQDIWSVDPKEVTSGLPVGLAWFSPDCKHFSKAKGGRPVEKKIRDLAWVVVNWAREVHPEIIMVENVEEFRTWGPLDANNKPDKLRQGETFDEWVASLQELGYRVQWKELRASYFGAPTIRKRLFIIARRDGKPIIWPEPTHGPGRLPERPAHECIDFSIPTRSIFGRPKPLSDATLKRIAYGTYRYVINDPDPFIVGNDQISVPTLIQTSWGERPGQAPRVPGLFKPLGTAMGGGVKHALVSAFLTKFYGTAIGADLEQPMPTVTAGGKKLGLVYAFLTHYYSGGGQAQNMREPMHVVTSKARIALVTVHGEQYAISDIGMRMLEPKELYAAQGFPRDYVIEPLVNGKPMTKTAQVRMAGNSVCPPVARALVQANAAHLMVDYAYAAAGGA